MGVFPYSRQLRFEPLERRIALAPLSSLPLLSSRPGAPVTVHLDFDGTPAFEFDDADDLWASGPMAGDSDPIPAFTIDGNALDYTQAELDAITAIWQHVSEKFSPFDINVTTVAPPNYNDGVAVHAIMGGSDNDWYMGGGGTTGVAPVNAFTNAAPNSAFSFTKDMITPGSTTLSAADRHRIAETATHEVGHTVGLRHQSDVDGSGNVLVEYANGTTNTAPIMGNSDNLAAKRGLWWNGPSSRRDENNNLVAAGLQDDLAVMTRPGNFINYRPDDYGSFSSSGSISVNPSTGVATAAGVIETNGDQDAFTFTAIGPVASFTVNNAALGGMLAPTLELIPIGAAAAGSVMQTTTNTSATLGATGLTPGGGYVLRVSRQGGEYGSLGQYTITGNTGTFATLNAGVLTVNGFDTSNDLLISYHSGTDNIVLQDDVFGGSAVQQFPRAQVNEIRVEFYAFSHDDEINVLGQFSGLNIPIDVLAGNVGTDTLILHGTTGADVMSMYGNGFALTNNSTTIFSLSIEQYILTGFDGADTYNISAVAQNRLVTVNAGGGNDVINVGTASLDPSVIRSPITINGEGGNDTLNLGGGSLDSITNAVTFTGGASFEDNRVIINDQTSFIPYEYVIGPSTVTRDPTFAGVTFFTTQHVVLNASNGQNIVTIGSGIDPVVEVNGNGGDDNFIVGGGIISPISGQIYNGGTGTNRITFDDHLNTSSESWDIRQTEVRLVRGFETIFLSTNGFESVGLLAGNGDDHISFDGAITKPVVVDGGGGNDDFFTNGSRADSLTLAGGIGYDDLTIDDRNIATNLDENFFYPNSVTRLRYPDQFNPGASYTVDHSEFEGLDYYLPAAQNYTTIYGSSPDIESADATFIIGNSLEDFFNVILRDGSGNLAFPTDLGIEGGGSVDTLVFNDSGVTSTNYTFSSDFGETLVLVDGMVGVIAAFPTVENLTFNAGGGNDAFNINSFHSGSALAINAGAGNDTVSWTPLGNNLAEISSMASFNYNGGADSDSMYVYNGSSPSGFDHYVSPGVLSTIRHSDAKQWVMQYATLEQVTVFATQLNDAFQIYWTSPGVAHALYGQGGTNSYSVGGIFPTTVQGVNSPVEIFGSGGIDNINLYNSEDSLARTYHVSQNRIGAAPGDNLFGPGGYVGFHAVVGTLTINNGNGADTIYAQPNLTTTLAFHGSNPTAAPGDTLNLVFAEALNPLFTPGGVGAGGYTFSNRAPLNYSGIETGPTIDLGPVLLSDYSVNNAVDAADYVVWRKTLGQYIAMYRGADGSGNGNVGPEDYDVWRMNFGKKASAIGIPFNDYYSQTFDTLPTGGASQAWSNDSTLAGWFLYRQPSPGTAITTMNAGDGSSSTGSFYSFGVLGSGALEDRALGGLGSGGAYFGSPATGAVAGWMSLALTNDTTATIDTLTLSFDGEQWRNGGNTVAQTLVLEYGFGSSFAAVSTWTAPGSNFDFTSPIHTASVSAVDGNAATNRAAGLGGTLNSLGWVPGSTLWFRWVERNDAGNDHALAIDNVEIALPLPAGAGSVASRLEFEPALVSTTGQANRENQSFVAAALAGPVAFGVSESSNYAVESRSVVERPPRFAQPVSLGRQKAALLWLTQSRMHKAPNGDAPDESLATVDEARKRYFESLAGDLPGSRNRLFYTAAEVIAIELASIE